MGTPYNVRASIRVWLNKDGLTMALTAVYGNPAGTRWDARRFQKKNFCHLIMMRSRRAPME